eukprot:NODE_906_length_3154_cov_0.740426.p2 type:complete len:271 gc:universal NODE_906_length_3154_cov_0.740426:1154-1966(+)
MLLVPSLFALTDCENLKQFAIHLNMPQIQPDLMKDVINKCCTEYINGVTCDLGVITSVEWSYLGLNGTIDTTFLPYQLIHLNLEQNQLNGTLPQTGYPVTLESINVATNQFSGKIPRFHNGLVSMTLENNYFTSFDTLPVTLTLFYANFNQLNQSFPENLPKDIIRFSAQSNRLNGTISNLPATLTSLNLAYNFMSGVIPNLPAGFLYLVVHYNQFIGLTYPLPDSLKNMVLSYNFIVGSIIFPPNIGGFLANSNYFYGNLPQFSLSLEY